MISPLAYGDCAQQTQVFKSLMRAVMTLLNLSALAYHRILKPARMTARLAGRKEIQSAHLAEAVQSEVDVELNATSRVHNYSMLKR